MERIWRWSGELAAIVAVVGALVATTLSVVVAQDARPVGLPVVVALAWVVAIAVVLATTDP